MKTCSKCGVEKPLSEFYTPANGKPIARCRGCRRLDSEQWRLNNKEKVTAINKKYCDKNKEKIQAYAKRYLVEHKDARRATSKKYADGNKEKIARTSKKWVRMNKEKRVLARRNVTLKIRKK